MKTKVIIAISNQLGGIAAFNYNIIEHTSLREQVDLKIILYRESSWNTPAFEEKFSWGETVYFEFNKSENRYSVLKRFSQIIGKGEGVLVCNDSLPLESETAYPTGKKIINIIHDYYNLTLSVKYYSIIDEFISHSKLFYEVMLSSHSTGHHFYYLPHGVNVPDYISKQQGKELNIIFIGRLVPSKGVLKLFEINSLLENNNVQVNWIIIGNGELKTELINQWEGKKNVTFLSPRTNKEVMEIAQGCHLFVLPTEFEGTPVSIVEAMSCGLVPIVSDLPGGIREVVTDTTGININPNDIQGFANAINELYHNRKHMEELSYAAYKRVKEHYNINITADSYFQTFVQNPIPNKNKGTAGISIGSKLDQKYLPNWLVKKLRTITS